MDTKTILIVDDEESVLFVLKNSLVKLGPDYRILTANDGTSALQFFEKYRIDLVITDYRMKGINGLELLETIKNVQPSTRVIFITAFGSDEVEAEVNRLKAFAYLRKPLDLATFRSVVMQAFEDLTVNRPGVVIHTDDINFHITQALQFLKKAVNARCTMIVDTTENVYVTLGEIEKIRKETLVAFINTSLSILDKAGSMLDGEANASTWLFRRGTHEDLYAGRMDARHLLVVLAVHEAQSSKINQSTELIRKTAAFLESKFAEDAKKANDRIFGLGFNQAVQSELDKLFTDDFEVTVSREKPTSTVENSQPESTQFTMSYEEALSVGLILPTDENENTEER